MGETEDLIKLGANVSSVDTGVLHCKENSRLVELLACHIDNMIWGGDEMFQFDTINKLKHTFQFECEEIEAFTCIGIGLVQDSDFGISINQNNYISSITETVPPTDRTKDKNSFLFNEEKKLYRSAVIQLSWFAGISRPYNSFSMCKASTKFKNVTIKEVPYVNTIINNVESTNYGIKCPNLSMDDLKLQLLTKPKFNNLPNG